MKMSLQRSAKLHPLSLFLLCLAIALGGAALAQEKSAPAKAPVTGHYEGSAKNEANDVISVELELTEKDGAMTGVIHSSHGDFNITGGTHKDDAVHLDFATDGGPAGVINLKIAGDQLTGTWTAGDDGGSIDVKKAAAPEAPKGK
jgi:hypothetical protein